MKHIIIKYLWSKRFVVAWVRWALRAFDLTKKCYYVLEFALLSTFVVWYKCYSARLCQTMYRQTNVSTWTTRTNRIAYDKKTLSSEDVCVVDEVLSRYAIQTRMRLWSIIQHYLTCYVIQVVFKIYFLFLGSLFLFRLKGGWF